MVPRVARDLVESNNALINGAALALFAIVSGLVGLTARSVTYRPAVLLGAAASALSMALFAVAVSQRQLAIFLTANATAGCGYSMLFRGGLNLINAAAPAQHHAGVRSALGGYSRWFSVRTGRTKVGEASGVDTIFDDGLRSYMNPILGRFTGYIFRSHNGKDYNARGKQCQNND
jgi:hypothetical protein